MVARRFLEPCQGKQVTQLCVLGPSACAEQCPSAAVIAIICVSVLAAGLGATLGFDKLADLSNVAVVVQYISTCIAILVWRTRDPGGSRFQLPLGPTIPIV